MPIPKVSYEKLMLFYHPSSNHHYYLGISMKKKECPSCAMQVDAKSKICPICGYEFPVANKIYQWLAVLLVVLFLLMLLL